MQQFWRVSQVNWRIDGHVLNLAARYMPSTSRGEGLHMHAAKSDVYQPGQGGVISVWLRGVYRDYHETGSLVKKNP
jgi:hypothetical protein